MKTGNRVRQWTSGRYGLVIRTIPPRPTATHPAQSGQVMWETDLDGPRTWHHSHALQVLA